jgi:hypothetical protein
LTRKAAPSWVRANKAFSHPVAIGDKLDLSAFGLPAITTVNPVDRIGEAAYCTAAGEFLALQVIESIMCWGRTQRAVRSLHPTDRASLGNGLPKRARIRLHAARTGR